MDLLAAVGTFHQPTDAAPVTQEITGLGFQPSALIMFAGSPTAEDTWTEDALLAIGFASAAASDFSAAFFSEHGTAAINSTTRTANSIISLPGPSETLTAEAHLASFDTDGFTLHWTTTNAAARLISYLALGGTDITNAVVGSFATAHSAQLQTISGLGFQPDAILFITTEAQGSPPQTIQHARIGFGAWSARAGAFGRSIFAYDEQAGASIQRAQDDSPVNLVSAYGGGFDNRGRIARADADGFTIAYESLTGTSRVGYLALAGISVSVARTMKPIAAGPITHPTPFPPNTAAALLSCNYIAPYSYFGGPGAFAFAALAESARAALTIAHTYANNASAPHTIHSTTAALLGTSDLSPATTAAATVDDLTPGAEFTWNPNDTTPADIGVISFYTIPAIPNPPPIDNFPFMMFLAADGTTPATGLTVAAAVSLDGAEFTPTTNEPVEIADGLYTLNLETADLAALWVVLRLTADDAASQYLTLQP